MRSLSGDKSKGIYFNALKALESCSCGPWDRVSHMLCYSPCTPCESTKLFENVCNRFKPALDPTQKVFVALHKSLHENYPVQVLLGNPGNDLQTGCPRRASSLSTVLVMPGI